MVTARQVHGSHLTIVGKPPQSPLTDTDGLLTQTTGVGLGVFVADCCAVYLVDRAARAIGLLHSGKQGTRQNIAGKAIAAMQRAFQTDPSNVLAVLSPCIGPCHYEMDIGAEIERQLRQAGVRDVAPTRVCTACHLDRF